jgi:serine/threonine protein kinase
VALKTLAPELAADEARRTRLAREARAIAALNHPNIVTVHSVEHADGYHFITMELVSGKTLAELIPGAGLALQRFFEIAIPLSDAVAAAHQQGITHRDLKPANVMIDERGRAKVLDFGLAKKIGSVSPTGAELPTAVVTQAGITVGTPAYMSPEQAQGDHVDQRSDIFSLGVMFYEMLSGRRPFEGANPAAAIAAILRDAPQLLTEVRPAVPRELARLVSRCLAKNPNDRFQSALDLRHTLEEVKQDIDSGELATSIPAAAPLSPRRRATPLLALAIGVPIVVALAAAWFLYAGDNPRTVVPILRNPVQVTSTLDVESYPSWSPDGQRVAYQVNTTRFWLLGNHDIWIAQLGRGEPVNLTKDSPANDRRPSWSPTGRDIAFYSDRDGEWGVYLVPAVGGSARKVLALAGPLAGSWSAPQWAADGNRLFVAANDGDRNFVIELRLDTLEAKRITIPVYDALRHWDLSVRGDGGRFALSRSAGW